MNIRQLRYFHLAARSGSFSKAARAENVSVQAVSRALGELEEELGGALFVRGGAGAQLTPLGKALVRPAREALASFDAVGHAAAVYRERELDEKPRLDIGLVVPPFAKQDMVCNALARLVSPALGARARIFQTLGIEALADLKAGAIDAMITVGSFNDPHCDRIPLGKVSVGVFMGKRHPLRGKRLLTFADLEPYPVLYNREVDDFNETVLASCRRRGLASPAISVDSDDGVADLLEERNGYVLGVYLKALDIKPLAIMHRIDPADAPGVPICLVSLKGPENEMVDRFAHFIRDKFSHVAGLFNP